jgi:hypothetical protein
MSVSSKSEKWFPTLALSKVDVVSGNPQDAAEIDIT